MLLLALCLPALSLAYIHSFKPRDKSPTNDWPKLEFNISLSIASLPQTGWAATYGTANQTAMNYASNGTKVNGTYGEDLALLAVNQTASLNITTIVGPVYVYGGFHNSSGALRGLYFTRNSTDVPNRASSSSGLIGLAEGHWKETPLTVHAGLSTVIQRIEVTTRMATVA